MTCVVQHISHGGSMDVQCVSRIQTMIFFLNAVIYTWYMNF